MDLSSINTIQPGVNARPLAADNDAAQARQAQSAQKSSASSVQTEQSVAQNKKVEPSREQLEDAVKATNDFLKPINNGIQFSLDDDTGKTIVKVIDLATKDVIRQFPSEEMLSIAKAIDQMKGLLVHQKA